ncbi:MAG: hypothetical protein V1798_12475 [Pseudomonadota bacterium]
MNRTDRGFTVLEIILATALVLLVVTSWGAVHRRHREARALNECEARRWQWTNLSQDIEWRLRQWEILAGPCIQAGFVPVGSGKAADSTDLVEVKSARPLLEAASSSNPLFLPLRSDFVINQGILVCADEGVAPGKITEVYPESANHSVVHVALNTEDGVARSFSQGTLLTAVTESRYDMEPSGKPPEKILYEKRSGQGRAPVLTAFEHFKLEGTADRENSVANVAMAFSAGRCRMAREFPIVGSSTAEAAGRWWLRGEDLVFEPWTAAKL